MTKEQEKLLADIFSLLTRYVDDEKKPEEIEAENMIERILNAIDLCPKCCQLMESPCEYGDEYVCLDCYTSVCDRDYSALKDGGMK